MPWRTEILYLNPWCALKRLEHDYVYHLLTDELYELNPQGFDFLSRAAGLSGVKISGEESGEEAELVRFCYEEGILTHHPPTHRWPVSLKKMAAPSLRYLELLITYRCNFSCKHCYLGAAKPEDMPLESIGKVMEEFKEIQGLRLLVSGGEPMMHPDFWEFNNRLSEYPFRSALITNGSLISATTAHELRFQEIQVSLDGLEKGHDALRGRGSFQKALRGIHNLIEADKAVAIATMIHAQNREDFPHLEDLIKGWGVKQWTVDYPVWKGNLPQHREFCLEPGEAAPYLSYGFGGSLHDSAVGFACGYHLAAVLPDGEVYKCAFFDDQPLGNIEEGLETCWRRLEPIPLLTLTCKDCRAVESCRGGCRYRALLAGNIQGPDPVQCEVHLKG